MTFGLLFGSKLLISEVSSSYLRNSFVKYYLVYKHNIIELCWFVKTVNSDYSYNYCIICIDSIGVNLICFIISLESYGVCVHLLNFVLIIS